MNLSDLPVKMWQKFCNLSRAGQIALVVFCLHFIAVFALSVQYLTDAKQPVRKRIAVRTVRPPSPRAAATPQVAVALPNHPAAPKKGAPAKVPPQKTPSRAKPKISGKEEVLLKEIAENLKILNLFVTLRRFVIFLFLNAANPCSKEDQEACT